MDLTGQQGKKVGAGNFIWSFLKSPGGGGVDRHDISPAVEQQEGFLGGIEQPARGGSTFPQCFFGPPALTDLFAQLAVPAPNYHQDNSAGQYNGPHHLQQQRPIGTTFNVQADPAVVNLIFFGLGHCRQAFVQYADQLRPVFAHGKGQLEPVAGCCGNLQIGQSQFFDTIGDGRQVAHKGIQFSPGYGFEGFIDVVGMKKPVARIGPLHQFLG